MREMKDSGVEWIGGIPSLWELTKIGSVYDERNTKVSDQDYLPLSVTKQGVVPQLETAAKTDNGDNRKLIKKNDFVINSRSDRRGSCGISEIDGSCSLINTVLKPRRNMCNRYYGFVFKSECFAEEYYRWGHGIVDDLWSTKWSDMKSIYIPMPSLEEQERIVDYLDRKCSSIDNIIAKQEQIIEKLKEYKLSYITETVTKGLDSSTEMKECGIEKIGTIPKSWSVQKMSMICKVITDYVASGSFASLAENVKYLDEPNYAMLIRTTDVSNKGYETKNVYIDEKAYEFLSNSHLFGGEIILPNIGASVGDAYIVPKLYERMSLAPNSIMIKTKYSDKYYYYYFCSDPGRKSLIELSQSAAQPKFNKTELRQLRVPVPSLTEQKAIVEKLDDKLSIIDTLITSKESIINRFREYKKSLIYEVVTGKKEV